MKMSEQKKTGRVTGALYFLLALCGFAGFIFLRPKLHVAGDAAQTARNLVEHAALARALLVAEVGTIITQALAALWFFKLFRPVNAFAGASVAAFGLVNAVAILGSAACMAVGVKLAGNASQAATVLMLFDLSAQAWSLGGIFFGLWLIPMGYAARESKGALPNALGWTLMVGGVGYVLSALIGVAFESPPVWLVEGLVVPASVGEFWMFGFLLIVGWREVPAPNTALGAS